MKKFSVLFVFMFVFYTLQAGVSDVFSVDKSKINTEMNDLNELENYVLQNDGITLTEMKSDNNVLALNIVTGADSPYSQSSLFRRGDPPLGIPSFVWGLCVGWVGILVVHLVADDRDETMKALWGCLVGGAVGVIFYVIYVAFIISSASSI